MTVSGAAARRFCEIAVNPANLTKPVDTEPFTGAGVGDHDFVVSNPSEGCAVLGGELSQAHRVGEIKCAAREKHGVCGSSLRSGDFPLALSRLASHQDDSCGLIERRAGEAREGIRRPCRRRNRDPWRACEGII